MNEEAGANHDALNDRINVRAFFERILKERDHSEAEREKRLDERFSSQKEAVTAAFAAQKEAVSAALAAADAKASKAEETAKETLKSHNDLIRQSRDRDATYATKDDLKHLGDLVSRNELSQRGLATTSALGAVASEVEKMGKFQAKILGALAVATILVPLVTAVIVFLITKSGH